MKEFTIQPSASEHSDSDISDEENWCTTTDTSIHSDLGSFLEDMAIHEGDITDYESNDESYYDEYEDLDYDETSEEYDSQDEEDKESSVSIRTEQISKAVIADSSDDESDESSVSYTRTSSYSSVSELSELSETEVDDLPATSTSCKEINNSSLSCSQEISQDSKVEEMTREI